VQVEVRDDAGVLIPSVDVALASGFAGALTSMSGVTSATGTFRTDYTAPTLTATQDDTVWVTVTKVQDTGDQASTSVTVHPPLDGLLSVVVTTSDASIAFDGSATITVTVRDALGVAVLGAQVVLSTDLPGGTFLDASGATTATGVYSTTFTPDVRQGMAYQILAEVSYGGYDSASDNVRVDVGSNPGSVTPVQTVPGFEAVAAIGAIALTFALVALARRRRED